MNISAQQLLAELYFMAKKIQVKDPQNLRYMQVRAKKIKIELPIYEPAGVILENGYSDKYDVITDEIILEKFKLALGGYIRMGYSEKTNTFIYAESEELEW